MGYTEWLLAEAREWLNSAPTLEELIEAQVAAANLELYIVDRPVARAARDNAAELATRFEREVDVRTFRATVLADASDPEFEQAITGLRATWRKPSPLAVEQKVRERRRYARAVDGDESVDAHAPMTNREVATSYARCANTANTAKPIISVAA